MSHASTHKPAARSKLVRRAISLEILSLGWMGFEPIAAIVSASQAHSLTLLAFGIDGAIELGSAVVVGWRFIVELRWGKDLGAIAERRARRIAATLLWGLGAYIFAEAIRNLSAGVGETFSALGFAVAVVEIPTMFLLAFAKRRTADQLGSIALYADAAAATSCTYLAVAVVVGMLSEKFFGIWWIDGITSLAISGFLIREGLLSWSSSVPPIGRYSL
jgi:Co/Zn/Cd efflux system component